MVLERKYKTNATPNFLSIVYICVYGTYNPEQPRISKLGESLTKAGYTVKWVISSGSGENVISLNTESKLSYFIKATLYLRKHLNPQDIVLGYVHIGGAVGLFSTLGKKTKFVFDYPDPWVGWYYYKAPFDNLKWKIGRLLFYLLEKIMYKNATYVTTASFSQLEFLQKQHGKKESSKVILNCPDINIFNKQNYDQKLLEKLELKEKTILLFLGTIAEEYGCDVLIDAFVNILEKIPSAHLLFLGKAKSQDFQKRLNQMVLKYNLSQTVTYHPLVSKSLVPHFLNIAKVGFIPFRDRFYNNVGSPNKLFEYMSCGVVPVASNMIEFKQYITDKQNGVLVQPENSIELAKKTIELLTKEQLLKNMANKSLKLVKTKYNWDNEEKKFLNIIKEISK